MKKKMIECLETLQIIVEVAEDTDTDALSRCPGFCRLIVSECLSRSDYVKCERAITFLLKNYNHMKDKNSVLIAAPYDWKIRKEILQQAILDLETNDYHYHQNYYNSEKD